MPSTIVGALSGGVALVSGQIFSGSLSPIGGITLKVERSGVSPVYVGILRNNPPDPTLWSGYLSGFVTVASGGALASGGYGDGMEVVQGASYFVPRLAISGNIQAIRLTVPTAGSGVRVFWDWF